MDQAQLLKGVLDLAVLAALDGQESYGYALVEQLRAAGLSDVADASVYGTLKRLEVSKLLATTMVSSNAGPPRKYYRLTRNGERRLLELHADWTALVGAIEQLGGRL